MKDAEFTCQNANAENKSLEALQQSYKDGRAMHWHSFYLVNESSGQRSPSGKAFGHSFLTTPLHPEWSKDWVFTAWPCQEVDSPADLRHGSTRKISSVNDNLVGSYLLHLTDFQIKWTGKKITNKKLQKRLGSIFLTHHCQLTTHESSSVFFRSCANQNWKVWCSFAVLPFKWKKCFPFRSSLPHNIQLFLDSQVPWSPSPKSRGSMVSPPR